MHPCITKPRHMREWWSSKWRKEFGHDTKYFLHFLTLPDLSAVFLGYNLSKIFRIHNFLTCNPRLLIYLAIAVWLVFRLRRSKFSSITESSSIMFILENSEMSCYWNVVTRQLIVHHDTPIIFEISFHGKSMPRSSSRISAGMLNLGLPRRPFVITSLLYKIVLMGVICVAKYC